MVWNSTNTVLYFNVDEISECFMLSRRKLKQPTSIFPREVDEFTKQHSRGKWKWRVVAPPGRSEQMEKSRKDRWKRVSTRWRTTLRKWFATRRIFSGRLKDDDTCPMSLLHSHGREKCARDYVGSAGASHRVVRSHTLRPKTVIAWRSRRSSTWITIPFYLEKWCNPVSLLACRIEFYLSFTQFFHCPRASINELEFLSREREKELNSSDREKVWSSVFLFIYFKKMKQVFEKCVAPAAK